MLEGDGSDELKRTNEIGMAIPVLEPINIAGKTITADALLTQRKLAEYLIERGAHYLFIAKDNHPTLAADIRLRSGRPMDQARVLVTGSFCEQPPLGLIKTLERAGCYIVDDDFVQVHRWIRSEISTVGDPLDSLVRAFLKDSIASPPRYIADEEKGRALLDRIAENRAEGVLFCAPSFCEAGLPPDFDAIPGP